MEEIKKKAPEEMTLEEEFALGDELTHDQKLAIKYKFIRQKLIEQYIRGCKYLKIAKIVVAIFFVIFTIVMFLLGKRTGDTMAWLMQWIFMIFFNVFTFLLIDYAKYLIDDKVIPFLNDDNQLDYGKYDLFIERDDLIIDEEEEE